MKRSMVLMLALALGATNAGCSNKEKDGKQSSKIEDGDDSDDDKGSEKKKHKKKSSDDDESAKSKHEEDTKGSDKEDEVDAKKILDEEDGGEASGVLDVKLPDDAKKDAPSLGGGAIAKEQGPSIAWLPAGPLSVPNPGWKRIDDPPATVLLSPDKKAGIVFTGFTTPQDGTTKVDNVVKFFKLRSTKWKKAKQVTIGPNKVPALFGSGSAIDSDGKPTKLFFALIKSGGPQNLLAIGLADADAPEATLKTGLMIVGSIKRN